MLPRTYLKKQLLDRWPKLRQSLTKHNKIQQLIAFSVEWWIQKGETISGRESWIKV